jgi:ribonucleoside-diphosphate reductase 2, operon protein nrdI
MKIVYFSVTGQTRRFIKKLNIPAYEIIRPIFEIREPFVLVIPTYDIEITKVVNDFMNYKDNREFCKGVAGGGNRNFADVFVFTAKDIAKNYDVPLLYSFEFSGTEEDVKNFKKVVMQIES